MNESRLNQNQQYLIEEFAEEYREHRIGRRELLNRAVLVTGSISLAATSLIALGCSSDDGNDAVVTPAATSAPAAQPSPQASGTPTGPGVSATDPAISVQDVKYPGQAGDILAYQARPAAAGTHPAVIVIHENRGLVDQTKDVARRYAKEGFLALAVDLASRKGGTGTDANANMAALGQANPADLTADLVSSVDYLKKQTSLVKTGALGVTGFCFGGNYCWSLAIASPDIKAAVPYYGVADLNTITNTKAAVLALYGGNDPRVSAQAPMVEQALKAAGKTIETKIYPGASHAFFNETGASYNAEAAADAWIQTLAWFRKYLMA